MRLAPRLNYEQQANLMRLSNMMNIQSSTVAQMFREYYRRFTVIPDNRGIGYGVRASSNETTAFFNEGIYRFQRVFYNIPMLESVLELDRLQNRSNTLRQI